MLCSQKTSLNYSKTLSKFHISCWTILRKQLLIVPTLLIYSCDSQNVISYPKRFPIHGAGFLTPIEIIKKVLRYRVSDFLFQ